MVGVLATRRWRKPLLALCHTGRSYATGRSRMRQPIWRRLLTAVMAAGLVGGMVLSTPSALAQPGVPPPPPAPVDPAAAPADPSRRRRRLRRRDPLAPASRPARLCRPPRRRSFRGCSPSRWRSPRARQQGRIRRRSSVSRRSCRRRSTRATAHGRRRQADLHQLPAAHRQPADGPGRRSHHVRSRPFPAGSTGPATPSCGGARRTSGRPAPRSTSTPRGPNPASPSPSSWSRRSTTLA